MTGTATPTAGLRRIMPGLYEGDDLRAERVDGRWRADAKMRDVGALASPSLSTNLYEYHPDGMWRPIGSFRTLRLAQVARDLLRDGTHFVQGEHQTSCGESMIRIPTRLVASAEAVAIMTEHGLAGG